MKTLHLLATGAILPGYVMIPALAGMAVYAGIHWTVVGIRGLFKKKGKK